MKLPARQIHFNSNYLTQQQLRMIDILYDLGYRDPGSFSRAFKTWTGISPRFRHGLTLCVVIQ